MSNRKWSKNFKECSNCRTDRFPYKANGYCARCYPLIKKLEFIKLWDLNNINSLKGYPKDSLYHNIEYFNKVKLGAKEQIKERLEYFATIGNNFRNGVDGEDIVFLFQKIAKLSGSKDKDFLWHQEFLFDHNFSSKQKMVIYEVLVNIEEHIRWKGLDYYRILNIS
jgi:hypothetical protein